MSPTSLNSSNNVLIYTVKINCAALNQTVVPKQIEHFKKQETKIDIKYIFEGIKCMKSRICS